MALSFNIKSSCWPHLGADQNVPYYLLISQMFQVLCQTKFPGLPLPVIETCTSLCSSVEQECKGQWRVCRQSPILAGLLATAAISESVGNRWSQPVSWQWLKGTNYNWSVGNGWYLPLSSSVLSILQSFSKSDIIFIDKHAKSTAELKPTVTGENIACLFKKILSSLLQLISLRSYCTSSIQPIFFFRQVLSFHSSVLLTISNQVTCMFWIFLHVNVLWSSTKSGGAYFFISVWWGSSFHVAQKTT